MDYTVHGILKARILEWVTFPFSRGSSQPRDWTQVSHIAGGFFMSWATKEALKYLEKVVNTFGFTDSVFIHCPLSLLEMEEHIQQMKISQCKLLTFKLFIEV